MRKAKSRLQNKAQAGGTASMTYLPAGIKPKAGETEGLFL